MLLVAVFFVSGADAASMVMGTLSQRGTLEPSRWVVVFWGMLTGGVAALLLWTGGSEAPDGLQTMTIIAAAPVVLVLIGLCFSDRKCGVSGKRVAVTLSNGGRR